MCEVFSKKILLTNVCSTATENQKFQKLWHNELKFYLKKNLTLLDSSVKQYQFSQINAIIYRRRSTKDLNCDYKLIYSIPKSGALMLSLELERLSVARNFCKLNDFFWEAPAVGKYLVAWSKVNKLLQEDILWLETGPITTEQKLYWLLQLESSTENKFLFFKFKVWNYEPTKPESKSLTVLTVASDCLPVCWASSWTLIFML